MRLFLLCVLSFISVSPGVSQNDLRFKRIKTDTGEDILSVQAILKDNEGYVWLASSTFDLVRFDGNNTRKYSFAELQTDYFKSAYSSLIFEDTKKNLWIGTDAGALLMYDRMMDKFRIINDSASSVKSQMFCQAEDKDGSFWLGTLGGGLLRFHPDTKKFKKYQFSQGDPNSVSDNYIVGLVFDKTGKLWIGTTRGLCSYDPQKDQFIRYPLPNKNPADTYRYRVIRSMLLSDGKLYLSTYGGLQIFDIQNNKSEHLIHDDQHPNSLSHNSLFQIAENRDGTFWIASYGGGLSLYNPDNGKFVNWKKDDSNSESISSNNLFTVYLDKDGLLWIGADDNTVCVHDTNAKKFNSVVHKINTPESISSGWVQTIFQENDSIFWLGLNGGGLNRLNLNNQTTKKYVNDPKDLNSLGHNGVIAIGQDNQKRIWVGLDGGGINMMDPVTGKFTRYTAATKNSLNNNAVSAMLVDKSDFIWATTFRNGLNIYDINNKKFKNINNDSLRAATGISLAFVKDVFELNGNIWFNTRSQVVVFDKKRNQFILVAPEGQVTPVTGFSVGEMRPYSETEMLIFNKGEVKTIRYNDPEHIDQKVLFKRSPGEELFKSFVIDRYNVIWYITKDHLVKWNPETGEKRIYNDSDGISSSDLHSLFQDAQGRIFITTLNGLVWFSPTEIRDDTVERKIVFTDFKIYNHSVKIGEVDTVANYTLPGHISQLKNLTLAHDHSFFSIEYTALEFVASEKINYAYKLDGFDNDWVEVGNRNFASYTNLDPGDYTFHVKAANPDGLWGNSVATILITINPPFWQTWWFISLSILALGSGFYAVHQYRLRQSLKVERLRTKIASDLHDEVGSSLTKISIFSDLVQTDVDEKEKRNYLLSIGNLSREIVGTMSDIVWSIDNKNDSVGALLIRMKDFATEVLQAKNIELRFTVSHLDETKTLEPALKQNLYLIFKESINNIVKHAHATQVIVSISNQQEFIMQIKDNGLGIADTVTTHGNGLRNMHRRARAIDGDFRIIAANGTTITIQRKSI